MAHKNLSEARLGALRDRRWSRADARLVLDELARSGDSVSAFARSHELSAKKIFWWRSQLAGEVREDVSVEELSFAPVVVTGLGQTPAVVLRSGALEIDVLDPRAVEPTWLAQLLAAMKGGE